MALESKPLYHPEVIRQQVRAFNLPERVANWQSKLQHWADLIASGRANDFKKTALLPDFLPHKWHPDRLLPDACCVGMLPATPA